MVEGAGYGRNKNWSESGKVVNSRTMWSGITILQLPIGPTWQKIHDLYIRSVAELEATYGMVTTAIGRTQENKDRASERILFIFHIVA